MVGKDNTNLDSLASIVKIMGDENCIERVDSIKLFKYHGRIHGECYASRNMI